MRHALCTLLVGAVIAAAGFAPVAGLAQEEDQNENQGQAGGLIANVSGDENVYNSAAGASGERVVIGQNPGRTSANNANGQGNRTANREERRAARAAERAAAAEAAPAAPAAPVAEPAPAAAPAPAPAAPTTGGRAVTALPDTGTGMAEPSSYLLALVLAGLAAAGASVAVRRAQEI